MLLLGDPPAVVNSWVMKVYGEGFVTHIHDITFWEQGLIEYELSRIAAEKNYPLLFKQS